MELSKKLDRSLLALHAAQTPATLSQATYACSHNLGLAQEAIVVFSPGPGLPPRMFHLASDREPIETRLHSSFPQDPLIRHLFDRESSGPVHLNRILSPVELTRSRFAEKWLQQPDLPYIVALSAVVRESSSVLVFLLRNSSAGEFCSPSLEQLEWLYSHFKIAWLRVFVREETLAIHHSLQTFLRQSPTGLTVLNWDLDVVYRNAEAIECCAHWNFGVEGARQVQPSAVFRCPQQLIDVCNQLKLAFLQGRGTPVSESQDSADQAAPGSALAAECASPDAGAVRALVRLVVMKTSALEKPVFQIRFSRHSSATPSPRPSEKPAKAQGLPGRFSSLTLREREVVACICRGLSNEAIAQQLSKSVPTVKNQLHSIFQKLSVNSRGALMALIQSENSRSRPSNQG